MNESVRYIWIHKSSGCFCFLTYLWHQFWASLPDREQTAAGTLRYNDKESCHLSPLSVCLCYKSIPSVLCMSHSKAQTEFNAQNHQIPGGKDIPAMTYEGQEEHL